MIGRLVITSVERGLGSGPGLQPVLRTKGMRPAVAERLRLRSGYAHPYPFGDRRNPVVYFHRIETVAGQRLHMLARVSDAGSDYSGRSNRISDLLVLDEAECQRRPGGPAAAAESFSWFQSWSEPPREVEPTIPLAAGGADEPNPRACSTWAAATGDAGWAGELAKSFLDGCSALVIARPEDDVLRLFADAMQLLPPAIRWNVTFTTCELDPSSASWRAVRSDITRLPRGGVDRGLTIDLEAIGREKAAAPDHAYSRFARGAGPAPWAAETPVAAPAATGQPATGSGSATMVREMHTLANESADVGAMIRQRRERMRASYAPTRIEDLSDHGEGYRIAAIATLAVPLCLLVLGVAYIAWFQFDPQAANTLLGLRRQAPLGKNDESNDLESKKTSRDKSIGEAAAPNKEEQTEPLLPKTSEKEPASAKPDSPSPDEPKLEEKTSADPMKELRRKAFADFEQLPERLQLVPSKAGLNPVEALPTVHMGSYDLDHLEEPSFELATPRFLIKGFKPTLTIAPDEPRTPRQWFVTARIPETLAVDGPVPDEETVTMCNLVAKDNRLVLEWDKSMTPAHPVVRLLQNSVLVASCKAPESDRRVAKAIFLQEPLSCADVQFDPLDDAAGDKSLGISDRLEFIDPDAVRSEVTVRHSSLDKLCVLRTHAIQKVMSLPRRIELGVSYDDADEHGKVLRRTAVVTITGTLSVDVARSAASWSPVVRTNGPDWVPRVFRIDRLRSFRDGKPNDLWKAYEMVLEANADAGSLNDALFREFQQDARFQSIEGFNRALAAANEALKNSEALPFSTEEQRTSKSNAIKSASDALKSLKGLWASWLGWRQRRLADVVAHQQEVLKDNIRKVGAEFKEPIVVRCDLITVDATIPGTDQRYEVTIVQSTAGDKH